MKFKNKVVIVTGAGTGIGREVALEFAKANAIVVVNYNNSEKEAENVVKEIGKLGSIAIAVKADVSKTREVSKMVYNVIDKYSRIDILINNAGIYKPSTFENITEDQWDKMLDINLKGVFNCIKKIYPHMKKQKSGRIVNISSIAAFAGSLSSVSYGVAKAGINNLTKTLSKEFGKYGITINAVAPGPVKTKLLSKLSKEVVDNLDRETPLGRIAIPEDIAKVVLFFSSSDADFVTGQTLIVDGGRL